MLIKDKKHFNIGLMLAGSFAVILLLIFSPIFGGGKNGLQFSDDLFNKLSKGSSYFIPKLNEQVPKFDDTMVSTTFNIDKPEDVQRVATIFMAAGAQVGAEGQTVTLSGSLGKILSSVLKDSDAMFKNDSNAVAARHGGMDGREVLALQHSVLSKMDKELKKQKKIEESNIVNAVLRRAIEPSYNFYGIEAQRVIDKAFTMIFLLVFYVAYTMWWGFAIFYMFEGLGLSMKKSKVKKEV
jgi:hypothetical protein